MLIKRFALACDRCGAEVPVDLGGWKETLTDAVVEANRGGASGWEIVEGKRVLCPACAPSYHAMADEHDRETREFFARACGR